MRAVVVIGVLALANVSAARGDEYGVVGRHRTRGAYQGSVQLEEVADGVRVSHSLAFSDGSSAELSGVGRRSGRTIVATIEAARGVVDALASALGADVALHAPMELRFETDGADRCRLRVRVGDTPLATASGARLPAVEDGKKGLPNAEGYEQFEGVPFVAAPEDGRDIHESDPKQGGIGDCYLIAALIASARNRPEVVRGMISDRGDGTYVVTLKDVGRFWIDSAQKVDQRFPYVSRGEARLPAYAQLSDRQELGEGRVLYELWPMLIEKAWAQWRGGYDKISGGNPGTVYDFIGGAGKNVAFWAKERTARALARDLDRALAASKPITVAFGKVGKLGRSLNLVGDHAYVLLEARDGGYVLYNPWGSDHPTRPLTVAELLALDVHLQVGGF